MPSAPSPAARARRTQLTRIRFRRALTLVVMTLVVPGSAQLVAGNRRVGRVAVRVAATLAAALVLIGLTALVDDAFVVWLASSAGVLEVVRYGLVILAIGWVYLFMDAWRLGDPLRLRQKQRLAVVGLNGLLCFSMAGALLFASHMVTVSHDFISTMFSGKQVSEAQDGRYNVLLMGGDSGSSRWGLRPDSLTVASIDADTGKTVLFGLPRNMQNFPFKPGSVMAKQYPQGYNCSTCELNSLFTWAIDHRGLFRGYANPGVQATKEAVEGITGLKINYYAMINLAGFQNLVDALGGVKLNVRQPIPIGAIDDFHGQYVPAGVRKLNGFQTLWFARSRMAADDYSRMARQKCVMNAMLHQLSPQQVVLKFGDIAKASQAMVDTDIPGSDLDTFVQLALGARKNPVTTVSFVPPTIETYSPDIAKIQTMVRQAIAASEREAPAGGKPVQARPGKPGAGSAAQGQAEAPAGGSGGSSETTGGSLGSIQDGYAANQASNLDKAC